MIKTDHFITSDHTSLFYRYINNGHSKWIIMTHGIGDHSERYDSYREELQGHYNIIQWDLRGHGKSSGRRGHVNSFDEYINDLDAILLYFQNRFNIKDYVLFGHSMGALITCAFLQEKVRDEFYPRIVFLNAPPVEIGGIFNPLIKKIKPSFVEKVLKIPGSFPVNATLNLRDLSHDPQIAIEHKKNPLSLMKIHSRLLLEVVRKSMQTFAQPLNLKVKAYVTVGSGDNIISSRAVINYFNKQNNFDVFEIQGAFHEIHHEIPLYRKPYFDYLKKALEII